MLTIVGTGHLGVLLGQKLVRQNRIDRLAIRNRSPRKTESVCLSLNIFSSIVGSSVEVVGASKSQILESQCIVIAAKDCYDPRVLQREERLPSWLPADVRTVGLRRDLPLIRSICDELADYRGIIFVVSNPLDIMTGIVTALCPLAKVYGLGGSLDGARIAYFLRTHGIKANWRDLLVAGEHGKNVVPLMSFWPNVVFHRVNRDGLYRPMMEFVRKAGPAIVDGLGFTAHDCAEVFADDIASLMFGDSRRRRISASVGTAFNCIGTPFSFRRGAWNPASAGLSAEEEKSIAVAQKRIAALSERICESSEFGRWLQR